MKAPVLKKWELNPKIEGILFFAQIVNELLFDFTIDTYKIPALNSHLLSIELLDSIKYYEANFLKYGNLEPIVKELKDRLKKDPVIKEIFKDYFEEFLKSLNTNQRSIADLETKINFLINKIDGIYFSITKKLLKDAIINSKEKEKISRLTRIFIIELINQGYAPEYIYFNSERFFFSGKYPKKIDNSEIIVNYFEIFSSNIKKFNVIFRACNTFKTIKDFAKKLEIEIVEDVPILSFIEKSKKIKEFLGINKELPLFLIVKNIESLDSNKPREIADEKLFLIDSLVKYHAHNRNLRYSEDALVYSIDQRDFCIVKKPKPPVMKRPERSFQSLSYRVQETVSTIVSDKLDEESLKRLFRAFRQHHTGVTSGTAENQLLGFWSAIEVLFPPKRDDEDRIVQISNSMIPLICSSYAAKLASDLYNSIKNSRIPDALKILEQISEGDNQIEKCLALFSIKSNEDFRQKIYKLFEFHPNLRNRIFFLNKQFSDAKVVLKTVKSHIERIFWQIRRIYRTRNLIIHSGKSVSYVNILVENLHSYLDRVLDVLNEEIARCPYRTTIDQCVLEIKLGMESHLRILESLGQSKCTSDNYKLILFGH